MRKLTSNRVKSTTFAARLRPAGRGGVVLWHHKHRKGEGFPKRGGGCIATGPAMGREADGRKTVLM